MSENENFVSNISMDTPPTMFSPPSPPPFPSLNDEASDYIYLTEGLAPYKNYYTTEWDEMFENVKSPMCDDISNYFFNPLKPLLPLDVIYPTILSPLTSNENDTPILLDSPPTLVVTPPPTTNHDAEIEKSTSPPFDASVNPMITNRPRKIQRTFNNSSESDSLTTPLEASQNTLACNQQKTPTSQYQTMSQFSTLITKKEFLKSAIIKVDHNEDVAERITSFAKERGYVCICGTVGSLSLVELLQQEKIVTFEGNFNIINLKGSLISPNNGDPMNGQLSITLAGSDGKVFGGVVHGRLIAQSTVQMNGFVSTSVKVNKTQNKQRKVQPQNESNNHHFEDL